MADFHKVATLSELKEGEVLGVEVGGERIALYKLGEELFATTDICTHDECHLSENFSVESEEVECTCHGSKFDIKSGEVVQPPAFEPLQTFSVKVEGEDVLVEI